MFAAQNECYVYVVPDPSSQCKGCGQPDYVHVDVCNGLLYNYYYIYNIIYTVDIAFCHENGFKSVVLL